MRIFHFFATLDGTDVIFVVAMVFRVARLLVAGAPFEITAGLDVRRKIEVERLIVVGFSIEVFTVVPFLRLPIPVIA